MFATPAKRISKLICASLLGMSLISACTTFAPEAAVTPVPTPTRVQFVIYRPTIGPTPTYIYPPTRTATALPTQTPTPLISATPLSYWRGMPIMPGAYNTLDEGDELSYRIANPIELVVAYYKEQMPSLGWGQVSETAAADGIGLYVFAYGDITITVAITQLDVDSETIVLIIIAR